MSLNSVSSVNIYLTISNLASFLFCVFAVSYMSTVLASRNNSHSRYIFKRLTVLSIACLVSDMLTYVFDMQSFFGAKFLNSFFMFASVLLTVCVGCLWNYFFDVTFHIKRAGGKSLFVYAFPAVITFVCLFVNLFTGFLFTIDENNFYSRGSYAFISFFLQYCLWGVLFFRAVLSKYSAKTARHSKLRISFMWLAAISLIFGLLQVCTHGKVSFHCFGITASIFVMFLRFQDDQITNDLLTGLNNRYALDEYMEDKTKAYHDGIHGGSHLYFIMMDVNNFKRINDIYGHVEGDTALKTVAQTLKRVGSHYGNSLFIARFGGDEFSAVFETVSEHKVIEICNEIKNALKSETEHNKYLLTISVGYSLYTGKNMSLVELYERADKALYEDKDRMKNG